MKYFDLKDTVETVHFNLSRYMLEADLTGTDPYMVPSAKSSHLGHLWYLKTVAGRASRRILPFLDLDADGAATVKMVKTAGLFLAAQRLAKSIDDDSILKVKEFVKAKVLPDGGWGYEFDVAVRWGRYGADQGNAIATFFAVLGLNGELDSGEKELLRNYLGTRLWNGRFFSYYSGSKVMIHNANILSALAGAKAGVRPDIVQRAIDASFVKQLPNGAWPYGEKPGLGWVDNFHSAYNLMGLSGLRQLGFAIPDDQFHRAIQFWTTYMFSDLTPLDRPGGSASSDFHTLSTAIYVLASLPEEMESEFSIHRRANHLMTRLISNLFEKVSINDESEWGWHGCHMRWDLAHSSYAMASFLNRWS